MDFAYWATWGEVWLNLTLPDIFLPEIQANFNLPDKNQQSHVRGEYSCPGKGKSSKTTFEVHLSFEKQTFSETDALRIDSRRPITQEAPWKPKLERNKSWLFFGIPATYSLGKASLGFENLVLLFWDSEPQRLSKVKPSEKNNEICIETGNLPQFSGLNIRKISLKLPPRTCVDSLNNTFGLVSHWPWYGGIANMLICNTNHCPFHLASPFTHNLHVNISKKRDTWPAGTLESGKAWSLPFLSLGGPIPQS